MGYKSSVADHFFFGNSLFYGLSEYSIYRLQKVQNTAARIVNNSQACTWGHQTSNIAFSTLSSRSFFLFLVDCTSLQICSS